MIQRYCIPPYLIRLNFSSPFHSSSKRSTCNNDNISLPTVSAHARSTGQSTWKTAVMMMRLSHSVASLFCCTHVTPITPLLFFTLFLSIIRTAVTEAESSSNVFFLSALFGELERSYYSSTSMTYTRSGPCHHPLISQPSTGSPFNRRALNLVSISALYAALPKETNTQTQRDKICQALHCCIHSPTTCREPHWPRKVQGY